MSTEKSPRQGTVGIYIGPGVKGTVTHGNRIKGMETGIADFGEQSRHSQNEISDASEAGATADDPKSAPTKLTAWWDRPLGRIFLAVSGTIIAGAAVALLRGWGLSF
jgi:hypothetical protein